MRLSFLLFIFTSAFAAGAGTAAAAVGIYAGGGLAAYGDLVTRGYFFGFPVETREPLGTSFWVGGGVAVPVWEYAGPVSPGIELATDVGFGTKSKIGEPDGSFDGVEIRWKTVAVKENVIFGVGVGPGGMFKPFIGFGAGVAVAPWSLNEPVTGAEFDSNTEVRAALGIPFGCEFGLTPNVGIGVKAEYLVITGDAKPMVQNENVDTHMPNPFLLSGVVRFDL